MKSSNRSILTNAFFKSQFSYYLLIWMCCTCSLNNERNRLFERCLRIVYKDKKSNFEELLERDGFVSMHYENVRFLTNEIFKVSEDIDLQIVKEIFQFRDTAVSYQLRAQTDFQIPSVHSVFTCIESIKFLGPKHWETLPHEIKHSRSSRK